MYLYSRHEKIRLLLPRIYTLYSSIWGKHFDASETWHDQIKVKEMEEIVTISLQTKKIHVIEAKSLHGTGVIYVYFLSKLCLNR